MIVFEPPGTIFRAVAQNSSKYVFSSLLGPCSGLGPNMAQNVSFRASWLARTIFWFGQIARTNSARRADLVATLCSPPPKKDTRQRTKAEHCAATQGIAKPSIAKQSIGQHNTAKRSTAKKNITEQNTTSQSKAYHILDCDFPFRKE